MNREICNLVRGIQKAHVVTDTTTVTCNAGGKTIIGPTTLLSTLNVADATTITGATTLRSTLDVTGATTLASTLKVTGNVGFNGKTPAPRIIIAPASEDIISVKEKLNDLLTALESIGLITIA